MQMKKQFKATDVEETSWQIMMQNKFKVIDVNEEETQR